MCDVWSFFHLLIYWKFFLVDILFLLVCFILCYTQRCAGVTSVSTIRNYLSMIRRPYGMSENELHGRQTPSLMYCCSGPNIPLLIRLKSFVFILVRLPYSSITMFSLETPAQKPQVPTEYPPVMPLWMLGWSVLTPNYAGNFDYNTDEWEINSVRANNPNEQDIRQL